MLAYDQAMRFAVLFAEFVYKHGRWHAPARNTAKEFLDRKEVLEWMKKNVRS